MELFATGLFTGVIPTWLGITEKPHLKGSLKLMKSDCQWKSKCIHIQIRFALNIYGESIWGQIFLLISSLQLSFPHAISPKSVWSHLDLLMVSHCQQNQTEYFKTLPPDSQLPSIFLCLHPQYISTKHMRVPSHQIDIFTLPHYCTTLLLSSFL